MGWAAAGIAVAALGVVLASAPIVFLGGAVLLVRVLADLWPRRVLADLEFRREVSPRKTVVGDPVALHISLWNRTRLPVAWATAQDSVGDGAQVRDRDGLVPLEWTPNMLRLAGPFKPFERISRRMEIVPLRRGVHEIGPVQVGVSELFGTGNPTRDPSYDYEVILARPLMAPVVGPLPADAPLARTRTRQSLFNDPTLFAGVRPYRPADPLRSVHWRASARQAVLQTKRFEPSLSRQQVLVLDVQTVEGPYWVLEYDEELFEDLCVAALSIARQLIGESAACGFAAAGFSHSLQRYLYLPPRADRSQIGRIGDALARLTSESAAPLTELLGWLPRRVARGTSIVVLTGRDPMSSAAVSKRLVQNGFPVRYLVIDGDAKRAAEARRAGLSARAARVEREQITPTAVVVDG